MSRHDTKRGDAETSENKASLHQVLDGLKICACDWKTRELCHRVRKNVDLVRSLGVFAYMSHQCHEGHPFPNRAFAYADKLWVKSIITVAFMDGSTEDHKLVRKFVQDWTTVGIGVSFHFQDDVTSADIRVSFAQGEGSYSYIGLDCTQIPSNEKTMNFGWPIDDAYGRATVLHEFGHALGLLHEHQSPFGRPFEWNEAHVIADCKAMGWSEEETRAQILNPIPKDSVRGTQYDPLSIMHYSMPKGWIKGVDCTIPPNYVLSALDKKFIRYMYPPTHRAAKAMTPVTNHKIEVDVDGPDDGVTTESDGIDDVETSTEVVIKICCACAKQNQKSKKKAAYR